MTKEPYIFKWNSSCAVCKQNRCYCPERQPDGSWVEKKPECEICAGFGNRCDTCGYEFKKTNNKIEKLELASAERNWESADIRDKINEIIKYINEKM